MPNFTVGMVGIGQLGLPIATKLINAGFRVVGYRRTDRAAFVALGGVALNTPAEVAEQADFILMCLPNESAQLEVMEGSAGLLSALTSSHTLIEMGTYDRNFKLNLQRRIHQTTAQVLESEVSGSPPMVAQGKAALLLGGSEELIDSCRHVLNAISLIQIRIGDFGSAVTMKLIANYLVTIHTLAAAEAMNLGIRAGYAPQKIFDVISQGAGASTMFSVRGPLMVSRNYSPAPGPFCTLEKYIHMSADLAENLGCATPLFTAARPYFERAIQEGRGLQDIAAVLELIDADSKPHVVRNIYHAN
ncbi:NAD(P)-dependent oxidoreductase [Pseudomonas yamanorum]|uniref:NAD(P)-dependent oxidoreductase n=1 Tax=Pseudomonas yamanorum TaxID=515393 RepID=A0A7Y8K6I3_9PSED|nr:NAD(P)-dependent oxidoreductase [Pseudomonas yamanorum]NWE77771.1 NAD(P)-dependent oxidoreductase [Pseudomonas yamanorum]